jgi:hypothetical protein
VEPLLWLLTDEAPIRFHAATAVTYGLVPAIFISQLMYWLGKTTETQEGKKVVRFSCSKWQRQLPFLGRTRIVQLQKELEQEGIIKVIRGKKVNRIALMHSVNVPTKKPNKYGAALLIFGTLAKVVGLREAIILQEVHLRSYRGNHFWARKSIRRWHNECLMFMPVRTLERLFPQLVRDELLLVKPGEHGEGHGYRVNYDKLKALMVGQTTHAPVIDWEKSKWLLDAKAVGQPVKKSKYDEVRYRQK